MPYPDEYEVRVNGRGVVYKSRAEWMAHDKAIGAFSDGGVVTVVRVTREVIHEYRWPPENAEQIPIGDNRRYIFASSPPSDSDYNMRPDLKRPTQMN